MVYALGLVGVKPLKVSKMLDYYDFIVVICICPNPKDIYNEKAQIQLFAVCHNITVAIIFQLQTTGKGRC